MSNFQSFPVGFPMLSEAVFEITKRCIVGVFNRADKQIVNRDLANRMEPFGNDGLFDSALGRFEQLRQNVSTSNVLRMVFIRNILLRFGENIKQKRLQKKTKQKNFFDTFFSKIRSENYTTKVLRAFPTRAPEKKRLTIINNHSSSTEKLWFRSRLQSLFRERQVLKGKQAKKCSCQTFF